MVNFFSVIFPFEIEVEPRALVKVNLLVTSLSIATFASMSIAGRIPAGASDFLLPCGVEVPDGDSDMRSAVRSCFETSVTVAAGFPADLAASSMSIPR